MSSQAWYQTNGLNDLKPDILWGSLIIALICSTLMLVDKIKESPYSSFTILSASSVIETAAIVASVKLSIVNK